MAPLRNYLDGRDALFVGAESPNYLCSAVNFWELDRHVTESDGRRYALDLALHAGDRYVARLVKDERPGGRPYFEPDPDFSVNNIYSFCRLGPESTVDDVVRHAFDTFAFAYDPKHQHWGVRLYEFANGKSMLVLRFRHALTDGQGFFTTWARWSAKMDNCSSNKGFQTKPVRHPMFKEPPMPLLVPTPEELEVLGKAAEHDAANHGAVRLSPHHNSEEKKKNGMMTRQCASSCTIPLSELKRFKRVLGCDAVNDSVIAMTTGALAKVVRRKGLPIDDYFCYSVPKSLRKDNDPDLCNRIGINLPYIPSGISSVVERAHVVSKIMKEAKASNLAEIGFKVNASILSPWDMDPEAPNVFRDRMNISISNVPESPYPLSFGPAKPISCIPTGPLMGPGFLNMTLYCLNGQVYIAIVMDHDTEAGPGDFYAMGVAKELCDAFEEEYKELTIEVNRLEAVQLGQAAIESRL